MFPSTIQKNIRQLDKQLSLLESECRNIGDDKRKKTTSFRQLHGTCSRALNAQTKPKTVKSTIRTSELYDGLKRSIKPTPNTSSVYSSSSLHSNFSKQCSGIGESFLENKTKKCGGSGVRACSCHATDRPNLHCNCERENKCTKCNCDGNESCNNCEENKKNHVLHKEVLFSNPGGTIEVTVTQKSSDGQIENMPLTKKFTLGNESFEKDLDSCHCQSKTTMKGPKWSELLYLQPEKGNDSILSENGGILDEMPKRRTSMESCNHDSKSPRRKSLTPPVKLIRQFSKEKNTQSARRMPEPEIQSYMEKKQYAESRERDPFKIFQFLLNELKDKPSDKVKKKLLSDMELAVKNLTLEESPPTRIPLKLEKPTRKIEETEDSFQKDDLLETMKKLCNSLMKEKETLSQDLAAKEQTIQAMIKRENDYLSLISSLKSNLDKAKENAKEGINTLKELNSMKSKLIDQLQVTEVMKKKHKRMQEILEKCSLENDKLKTQIQIYKLESQKHDVLLAGKEAEIKRYREEIENFQKQISDHLANLRSNAQAIDLEKMMEVIIQQSQIFSQCDLDSIISERDQKDSSRYQNGLMHSSPTSTKTSEVNSSWKQISSIRDSEQVNPKTDVNNDDIIEIFGSERLSSAESRESLEKLSDNKDEKKAASFTSCITVRDEEDELSNGENDKIEDEKGKGRSSIDKLLQNMKLNWAKEVYGTSTENGTIDDFLNGSQISSVLVDQ